MCITKLFQLINRNHCFSNNSVYANTNHLHCATAAVLTFFCLLLFLMLFDGQRLQFKKLEYHGKILHYGFVSANFTEWYLCLWPCRFPWVSKKLGMRTRGINSSCLKKPVALAFIWKDSPHKPYIMFTSMRTFSYMPVVLILLVLPFS